jgi:hypothetical protein
MVEISYVGDRVQFEVEGADKFWAMKSRLDIPLAHVKSAWIDPEAARGWWHGIRFPGTQIPGLILAGTFYQSDGRVFYDVHHPDRTIIIELDHESYTHLVIEVEDPPGELARLKAALAAGGR